MSSFERRGRGHGHDGGAGGERTSGKPGGRTLVGNQRRQPTRGFVLMALDDARKNLARATRALPALEVAVDPHGSRDMLGARDKASDVEIGLGYAKSRLECAADDAGMVAPDLLGEVAALRAFYESERIKAEPLLDRKPPNHTSPDDSFAAAFGDHDAQARIDAAEQRAHREWNEKLDAVAAARHVTAEPQVRGDAPTTIDKPAEFDESASPARLEIGAAPHHAEHVTAEPHVHAGAPTTIDKPPEYDDSRATLQLRADTTGAAAAPDTNVQAVAASGVANASSPLPHLDAVQRAFGRHDVSHVRAEVGGGAEGAARAIGAEAYATGDQVAFASAPDLHTAAHEAAHVVQQQAGVSLLGGVGAAGDPYEQHADRVADAVVAGASAESILDEHAGNATSGSSAVQREAGPQYVNARVYLDTNIAHVTASIDSMLTPFDFPQPDPQLRWQSQATFRELLVHGGGDAGAVGIVNLVAQTPQDSSNLKQLCHPTDPFALVDQMRAVFAPPAGEKGGPVGPDEWKPSIGVAIAQAIVANAVSSLRRLGPRWVAAAGDATDSKTYIPYDQLVTSSPMDRVVGKAMTSPDQVFDYVPDPKRPKIPANAPGSVRPVTFEWQGERSPKFWNWIKATNPADATVEEVASSLFGKADGERGTSLAYVITPAPPLFGIPPEWARQFDGAKAHAPSDDQAQSKPADRLLDVATDNDVGGEIALAQGAHQALPAVQDAGHGASTPQAALTEIATGNQSQLYYLINALGPWGLVSDIQIAQSFLLNKLVEVVSATGADLAPWARVFTAQRENLLHITGAVHDVIAKAKEMGVDPQTPDAGALHTVLAMYARAAAVSHMADTCRELIDQATAKEASLTLLAVQGSMRGMDQATESYVDATGKNTYQDQATELDAQGLALQNKMLAGGQVDPSELEEYQLKADLLTLRARAGAASHQLESLEGMAEQARQKDTLSGDIAAAFGDIDSVIDRCKQMEMAIGGAIAVMDVEITPPTSPAPPGCDPGNAYWDQMKKYEAGPRDARVSLAKAKAAVDKVASTPEFAKFLSDGASSVKWQEFRVACVQVAELIGVSLVAGGVGAVAADAIGGAMMTAEGVDAVADLSAGARMTMSGARIATDAAVNAAGQSAAQGQSFTEGFLENLAFTAGTSAILGDMARDADKLAEAEEATKGLWQKAAGVGKFVLKEAAALTGHTLMGAAMGYVSHLLVTGKSQPPPATLEEWFLQGASIAVGRYIHKGIEAHMHAIRRMSRVKSFDAGPHLLQRAIDLEALAERVQSHPQADQALELLTKRHEMIVDEIDGLQKMLDDSDDNLLREAGVKRADAERMRDDLHAQLDDVHDQGYADVTFKLAGLEELVPGAVWRGSEKEAQAAVDSAKRQASGTKAEVNATRDPKTGTWTVNIGDRTVQIETPVGEEYRVGHQQERPKQVVLAGSDAELREAAQWVQPLPGTLDVIVHGDVDDFMVEIDGREVRVDHRRLAKLIERSGQKYERVRLVSCRTGVHAEGVAQHLANKLGVQVLAPSDNVYLRSDGNHSIGPKPSRPTGEWRSYMPSKSKFRYSAAPDTAAAQPELDTEQEPPDGSVDVGAGRNGRPSWQESEQRVTGDLDWADFDDQRSFRNGEDVPRGSAGSKRPDNYSEAMKLSVDVKNYDVQTSEGRGRLVANVLEQLKERVAHLPPGTRQAVVLDVRGQTVAPKVLTALHDRLVKRSNGVLHADDVVILSE